jgi:hypothetical protein
MGSTTTLETLNEKVSQLLQDFQQLEEREVQQIPQGIREDLLQNFIQMREIGI